MSAAPVSEVSPAVPEVAGVAGVSGASRVDDAAAAASATAEPRSPIGDILTLGKPQITLMAVLTAAGGFVLAPGAVHFAQLMLTLAGTALLVASANTLNMWLERSSDRLMTRTARRPLPAGRMAPGVALLTGILEAAVGAPLLTFTVNGWAGLLGVFALLSYVLVYTPMKRLSPWALHVGAIPGAIPPLLGWAAATGRIDAPGLVLFGILFLWQLPHFIAIALFRKADYARAGIRILPVVKGDAAARVHALVTAVMLAGVSVLLYPLGVAGLVYLLAAIVLGALFVGCAAYGVFARAPGDRWARQLFGVSLLYLTLLFVALMAPHSLG